MKNLLLLCILMMSLVTFSCKSKTEESATANESAASSERPAGQAFQVDVPRSQVKWSAFKPTGTHHGIIPISGGTIYLDGGLLTGGAIEINMAGLQVQDMNGEMKDKLEGHLKGTTPGKEQDFFNVGTYPTATFTILNSSKLENDPLGTHMINGELKIKDIVKPVSFKAILDLAGGTAIKATTEPFVIDRTDWDIKFKSKKFFDDLKDDFINDEVKMEIVLGAIQSGK